MDSEGLLHSYRSLKKNSKGLLKSYRSLKNTKGIVIRYLEVLRIIKGRSFFQIRPFIGLDINTYDQINILSYLLK